MSTASCGGNAIVSLVPSSDYALSRLIVIEHIVPVRFFFDLTDDQNLLRDEEGVEADSLADATAQAKFVIAEMSRSGELEPGVRHWKMFIRSTDGAELLSIDVIE